MAVVALKPAVVVVSDLEALQSPLRAALPKSTRFVWDAGEPYKVLTGAPSLNRLVGAAALAAILHPDKADGDPDAILRRLETMLFPIPPGLAAPGPAADPGLRFHEVRAMRFHASSPAIL